MTHQVYQVSHRASQQKRRLNVRFGSGAHITRSLVDVRFTRESGH